MRKHFSEYFRPTEAETTELWAAAVFIFDTNVLLNLYRVSRETSLKIRDILRKLKGRLFLPHQVGVEFFKHLEEEIAEQVNAFERVRQYLKKIPERFKQEFSRHPCIPIAEITEALKKCTDQQVETVTASQKGNQLNFLKHDDPILPELDEIFANSSEEPYNDLDNDSLNKKVEERVQQNLAPCVVSAGGKASKPPADNPHRGDGRVWFQIVKHAGTTKKPIIFVTGDEKPNWWRTARLGNNDRAIGPHFELVRDVESASGNKFMMYTQEGFLSEAPKYLDVPEQTRAIEELKQFRESASFEKDIQLSEETKTISNREHGGNDTNLLEKDVGPIDQTKTGSFEEAENQKKAESDEEEVK